MKKRTENLWFTLGVICLSAALLLFLYNNMTARQAAQASEAVLNQMLPQISEAAEENASDGNREFVDASAYTDDSSEDREMPTILIDGYAYIGYLSVPSINLTLPVMEDWDYDRLQIAPCRYSGSYYQNNLVIAGHNYAQHFSPLRWLSEDTEILFTTTEGIIYHYHIDDLDVLEPTQIADMTMDTEDWDLTLFTCTIGGQTRHTIRCVLDEITPFTV